MSHLEPELENPATRNSGWGLVGIAAVLGLAAATLILVSKNRATGKLWSVDDLVDAADRAADNLERSLLGDHARAS